MLRYLVWGNKGIKSKKQLNLITLINVNNSYASFGFDNLSFIIGRDRLGVGNGYTGNLELGENTFFDDFAKLSFINDESGEKRLAQDAQQIKQNTFKASLGANIKLYDGLFISAKGCAFHNINDKHVEGQNLTDIQLSIGVHVKPLDFFDIKKPL